MRKRELWAHETPNVFLCWHVLGEMTEYFDERYRPDERLQCKGINEYIHRDIPNLSLFHWNLNTLRCGHAVHAHDRS